MNDWAVRHRHGSAIRAASKLHYSRFSASGTWHSLSASNSVLIPSAVPCPVVLCCVGAAGMPVALVGHNVTQLGLRPPWVPGVAPPLKELVEECWAQDPNDRCEAVTTACAQSFRPRRYMTK